MTTPASTSSLNPIGRATRVLGRWIAHRSAASALRHLDDHLLKDMGLHRSEIERAVRIGRHFN